MTSYFHGSFRDPSGYMVRHDGVLYRVVMDSYCRDYDALMESGLFESLVAKGLLVGHTEVPCPLPSSENVYKTLQPVEIPFISYPYEWSFSQLKDAALLTLRVMKLSLDHNMILKDSSAYNVQFFNGKPIFIDTLSFKRYEEGRPWLGYRQFCQHFAAPLALMAATDVRLISLMRTNIDGVPLDLASRLLPFKSRLKFSHLMHIHLHAKSQKKFSGSQKKLPDKWKVSRNGLLGIISSLESMVRKTNWKPGKTEWGDYYNATNYSDAAFNHKKQLVRDFAGRVNPESVWDLGANTGVFSRIAGQGGAGVVSFDIDPVAVEANYRQVKAAGEANILPLVQDLVNPSPGIGWMEKERDSFLNRGPVDLCMALALVHHLVISNNTPLPEVVRFFSQICSELIIEFVPKEDSQAKVLLATREDIFPDYTREGFETHFKKAFKIVAAEPIKETERILYLMERLEYETVEKP